MKKKAIRQFRQILCVLLILYGLGYLLIRVRYAPLVNEIAALTVENKAAGVINDAIDEAIAAGELEYDRLITLEKDKNGDISAVETNMAEVNRLKTAILDAISRRIGDISSEELSIPVGTVLLPELLSGHGPRIPVSILTVTASNAAFSGQFSEAGINQTQHQIMIEVTIHVTAITPSGPLEITARSDAVVAETVIVGRVPQTFLHIDQASDKDNKEVPP